MNEGNIRTLTKELLDYLRISDSEFKPDLTNKICMLVQRFAPDKRWHLDSLMQVQRTSHTRQSRMVAKTCADTPSSTMAARLAWHNVLHPIIEERRGISSPAVAQAVQIPSRSHRIVAGSCTCACVCSTICMTREVTWLLTYGWA